MHLNLPFDTSIQPDQSYPGNAKALEEGRITLDQYHSMAAYKFLAYNNCEDLDIERDYRDYGIIKVSPYFDGERQDFWLWCDDGMNPKWVFDDDPECIDQNITDWIEVD